MADTSGTVTSGTLKHSYFYVTWQQTSQNIANNYTTINWQVGLNCGTSSGWDAWYSNAVKVNDLVINGSSVLSNATYSNISGAGNHQLTSGSVNIYHNNDGTKSFTISISGWLYSYGNTSGSKSFTLPVIARTSTVSATSFNIGSPTTITITRQSSSFTHTLTWSFGSKSGTIATKTSSTSVSSTLPVADLYSQLGDNSSKAGTISCQTYSGNTLVGTSTCSFTATAVKSTVSASSFNIGDATTITISRAASTLTHTLEWSFGSASGTIATKTSSTSVGTTLNASTLYAQIPSATYGTGTITCKTYSVNTLIGSSTCSFTAYAKANDCKPQITGINIQDSLTRTKNLTDSDFKLIEGESRASIVITANARNSASIVSYYIQTATGQTATSASSTIYNIKSPVFYIQVKDSRGYITSTTYTVSTWIHYFPVSISKFNVARTESTGDAGTLTVSGNYIEPNFGTYTNQLTVQYRYKESNGSFGDWTTITCTKDSTNNTFSGSVSFTTELNHEKEYVFEVKAQDRLNSETLSKTLPKGMASFRIGTDYIKTPNLLDEGVWHISPASQGNADAAGIVNAAGNLIKPLRNMYFLGVKSAGWKYIGEFDLAFQGRYAAVDCFFGNGQNGRADQNTHAQILLKQGWTGVTLPIGVTTRFTQNYDPRFKVKIAHDGLTKAKLYIYLPWSYSDFTYTLNGSYVSFEPSNTELSSAPTTDKESTYYGLMEEYSTDERAVGTWIDGTPIYKKTITITSTALSAGSNVKAHGISNMSQIIKVETTHIGSQVFPYINLNASNALSSGTFVTNVDTTNITIRVFNDSWGSGNTWYITLYYTKSA